MKIFVTGASGFIGTRVVELLLNDYDEMFTELRVLVRKEIPRWAPIAYPKLRQVIGTLQDKDILVKNTNDVNIIIHIAAKVSDWGTYQDFYKNTVLGTVDMIDAAKQANNLKRFVYISTADVYGYPVDAKKCDENRQMWDTGLYYNKSKVLAEKEVWKACKEGLPVTVIRPTNVYGPGGKDFVKEVGDFLKYRIFPLINGGKSSAGLVYVDNCARAIINSAFSDKSLNNAYNVSDEDGDITWEEYTNRFADEIGYKRPWLKVPSWLIVMIALILEMIFRLLRIYSFRPPITVHSIYLVSRDQFFPVEKGKSDGVVEINNRVSISEGIRQSAIWYKSLNK